MTNQVDKNDARNRYEIRVDGELAGFARYREDGDVIVFEHTEVDDRFQGQGLATEVVRTALDDVRAQGLSVQPRCPLVRKFIAENAEYQDLVRDGDKAEFDL